MEVIFSTLINGLSLGGIYAMIALGYTMVYGIAKMLNFAHGDVIMVGAYLIYVFIASTNPLLAILFFGDRLRDSWNYNRENCL